MTPTVCTISEGRIETSSAADYDCIQRFLEEAYEVDPGFFPREYPCLWRRENTDFENTYFIRREAEIVCLIRVFPLQLILNGRAIKVAGIGAVATLPRYRGQGHMNRLFQYVINEMKAEGFALSVLGGDRHRYQPFGYELAGETIVLSIGAQGLKNCDVPRNPVSRFSGESAVLAEIKRVYEENKWRRIRTAVEFELAWDNPQLLLFSTGVGTAFGYLGLQNNDKGYQVVEFGGDPMALLCLCSYVMERHSTGPLQLKFASREAIPPAVLEAASGWIIEPSAQIKILDLDKTLSALGHENLNFQCDDLRKLDELELVEALFGTANNRPFNFFIWPLDLF